MRPKTLLFAGLCVLFLALSGCMAVKGIGTSTLHGFGYQNYRIPLTEDLDETPAVVIHADGKVTNIREPFSGFGIYARWRSNAIGDIAKKYGLKKVYFADLQVFSVLGIVREYKVHIYGEREEGWEDSSGIKTEQDMQDRGEGPVSSEEPYSR